VNKHEEEADEEEQRGEGEQSQLEPAEGRKSDPGSADESEIKNMTFIHY